ncbi:MAG: CBS domain-containing protein [Methanomicrobiales archaeon]|nr:CBS domain-containing protein [Methanomicrobiales archaeon]
MKDVSAFLREVPVLAQGDNVTKARQILRDDSFREIYIQDSKNHLAGVIDITDVLKVPQTRSNVTVEGFMRDAPAVLRDERIEDATIRIRQFRTDSAAVVDSQQTILGGILLSDLFPVIITRNRLHGTVHDHMSRDIVSCEVTESIKKIYSLIVESSFTVFPVTDKRRLVGIVSRRDILKGGRFRHTLGEGPTIPVREVMTSPVHTISPEATISAAAEIMAHHEVSCLPVITGGALVGILDRHDVLKGLR